MVRYCSKAGSAVLGPSVAPQALPSRNEEHRTFPAYLNLRASPLPEGIDERWSEEPNALQV